jgi:hypothetical protein
MGQWTSEPSENRCIKAKPVDSSVSKETLQCYHRVFNNQINRDKTAPTLAIKEVSSDARGVILVAEYLGAEVFSLLGTKAGKARGGHHHPYPVRLTMPIG